VSMPRLTIGKTIVRIRTGVNPGFKAALKQTVRYPDSRWDDQYMCWKAAIHRVEDVKRVLFQFYDTIEIREKGQPDRVIDATGREVRQETLF